MMLCVPDRRSRDGDQWRRRAVKVRKLGDLKRRAARACRGENIIVRWRSNNTEEKIKQVMLTSVFHIITIVVEQHGRIVQTSPFT